MSLPTKAGPADDVDLALLTASRRMADSIPAQTPALLAWTCGTMLASEKDSAWLAGSGMSPLGAM